MSFLFSSLSTFSLLIAAVHGGVQPWAPCANLNSNVCLSSDFSARPSNGVSTDSGLTGGGAWTVAGNTLSETSHNTGVGSGDVCVRQLGVIQYMPTTNLENLFQVRVKVRVNATAGGAGGILFGDRDGAYFRFQLNTDSSCSHSSAVAFRTAFQGAPGAFSNISRLGSTAARSAQWYELRLRISFADSTHGRLDVSIIEQNPLPGPVLTGPSITLDSPSLSVGTKIGLWCSSSAGCDFKDYVIVQDSLRGALTGQLDCHACNLMWVDGQSDWCRCCQQDCPPFDRSACVSKGLCTSLCMTNQYCAAPTTPAGTGVATTPAPTTTPTTTKTTTTTAPVGTSTPVGTGNPASSTSSTTTAPVDGSSSTAPIGTGSDSGTNGGSTTASVAGGDSTTSVVGGSNSNSNSDTTDDVTLVPSSATSASAAAAALSMAAAVAVI